jgi:hypothetical protein
MALIYFVSFQEAYVRDYLGAALAFRTELLKSDKTITFKEACDCASFDSLVEYLATKQAEDVTDNIDETAEYFEKRFNLPLASKFKQWTVLREASYRRNLVVHNGGIANKIYCAKIKGDAREGERLNTDVAYVVELADAISYPEMISYMKLSF